MRTLKTSEAAALLTSSPNTFPHIGTSRFELPRPQRSSGRHRLYIHRAGALPFGDGLQGESARSRPPSAAHTAALTGDPDSLVER